MTTQEKMRENRLRDAARRQGLYLQKTRRHDPRALDFNRWMIVDQDTDGVVAGAHGTGRANFTIDDVERYLTGDA